MHNNGVLIATFYYDGKNRQIARNLTGTIRFSVWDGWELIEEYRDARTTAYLQGATGVIKSWGDNGTIYYYQDKLGSTSHIADANGALLEGYRYDLYGAPTYYDANGQLKSTQVSGHGVVDLYAGERWIPALGLYDLRNRFMSPGLGRFLSEDPIGFAAGDTNLFRYCGGDPVNWTDPFGLTPGKKDGKTRYKDGNDSAYYGYDPYPDDVSDANPLEGVDESTMDRVTLGGAPVRSGNAGVPGGLGNVTGPSAGPGGPGSGTRGDGSGPGGARDTGGNGTIPNPYRASGPIIAQLAPGFDRYNLPGKAKLLEETAQYVPDFIPGAGVVSRGARGLITPAKYFGGKTAGDLIEALTRKFGPPRSVRPGAQTFYNPRTGRSFNVHTDPAHGSPHVDIRRRGPYKDRKYFLDE